MSGVWIIWHQVKWITNYILLSVINITFFSSSIQGILWKCHSEINGFRFKTLLKVSERASICHFQPCRQHNTLTGKWSCRRLAHWSRLLMSTARQLTIHVWAVFFWHALGLQKLPQHVYGGQQVTATPLHFFAVASATWSNPNSFFLYEYGYTWWLRWDECTVFSSRITAWCISPTFQLLKINDHTSLYR